MIHMIPNHNRVVVVYQGELKLPTPSTFKDPAFVIGNQRVLYDDLDEWYIERMLFDWRGKTFGISKVDGSQMVGSYVGQDDCWAKENKLKGNRYDGWQCCVSEADVENIQIERIDLLESWRYRKSFRAEPPYGLFRDIRPATDHEWVKD